MDVFLNTQSWWLFFVFELNTNFKIIVMGITTGKRKKKHDASWPVMVSSRMPKSTLNLIASMTGLNHHHIQSAVDRIGTTKMLSPKQIRAAHRLRMREMKQQQT